MPGMGTDAKTRLVATSIADLPQEIVNRIIIDTIGCEDMPPLDTYGS